MVSRLASSILCAVMLNVAAIGGGLYSIDAGSNARAQSATTMNEMASMPGMNIAESPSADSHTGDAPADEDCNVPWSPGCGFLALCASPAMTANRTVVVLAIGIRHGPPAMADVLAPASADLAPDHPPPRA